MARNQGSYGPVSQGLDFGIPTQDVQKVQEDMTQQVQDVQEKIAQQVQKAQEEQEAQKAQEVQKEVGTTQGKKGQKLKRINMAFGDVNHDFITKESRMQGMTVTAFVNWIIEQYRLATKGDN